MENNDFSFSKFEPGNIITGKVIKKSDGNIYVDINYKSEGIIPEEETRKYDYYEKIKEGDEIEVFIKNMNSSYGCVLLSKIIVDKRKTFYNIKKAYNEKTFITGKAIRAVKGGYIIDLGANINAFLPMSHTKYFNGEILGNEIKLKIIEFNEETKNIIVSYKEYFLEEQKKKIDELKKVFPLKEKVKVKIKEIKNDGLNVEKDGFSVFIPKEEVLWNDIIDLNEKFIESQELEVTVKHNESGKIILSLKDGLQNPYKKFIEINKQGTEITGKIVKILDDKMILLLADDVLGILMKSEISYLKKIQSISDLYKIGEEIKAIIIDYNEKQNKIYLSIKQMQENPWNRMEERYPVGARVIGIVKNIIEGQGIEVELEENVDAFVNIKDISWFNFNKIEDVLKIGDKKEFKIIGIDKNKFKILLGLKQLSVNPWVNFINKFKEGMLIDVKILDILDTEIVCQIIDGVNGKIPIKNKNQLKQKQGDTIKAKIIKIDKDSKKVTLYSKELEMSEEKKQLDEYIKIHEHFFKMDDIIDFKGVNNKEDNKK